jgi:hypothetical protein
MCNQMSTGLAGLATIAGPSISRRVRYDQGLGRYKIGLSKHSSDLEGRATLMSVSGPTQCTSIGRRLECPISQRQP